MYVLTSLVIQQTGKHQAYQAELCCKCIIIANKQQQLPMLVF
jgi:hypothetical protein